PPRDSAPTRAPVLLPRGRDHTPLRMVSNLFPPRPSGPLQARPTPTHTPGQGSPLDGNARCPPQHLLVSGERLMTVPAGKVEMPPRSPRVPSRRRAPPP